MRKLFAVTGLRLGTNLRKRPSRRFVYPGSPAERAGLQVGDVIHTANGYLIEQHGNLAWIISSLPANGVLQMSVRTARDGMEHTLSAPIP